MILSISLTKESLSLENACLSQIVEIIKLELIWTIIPAIVLTVLIGWGLIVWGEITGPPPEDAEVIEVVGYQFAWASRYPGKDNKLGSYNYTCIMDYYKRSNALNYT